MKHLCIANEGILMNLGSKFQGIFLFSMGLALLLHIRMNPSFQSIEGLPLISIASIENFERMTPYRSIQDFVCKFFNASNRGSVYTGVFIARGLVCLFKTVRLSDPYGFDVGFRYTEYRIMSFKMPWLCPDHL